MSLDGRRTGDRQLSASEGDDPQLDELIGQAGEASDFLKALSHEGRLLILCHLLAGERSVTDLEHRLGSRQAAVSQQLARLRVEGLVTCRRNGKTIYYSISDPKVRQTIALVYAMFCGR